MHTEPMVVMQGDITARKSCRNGYVVGTSSLREIGVDSLTLTAKQFLCYYSQSVYNVNLCVERLTLELELQSYPSLHCRTWLPLHLVDCCPKHTYHVASGGIHTWPTRFAESNDFSAAEFVPQADFDVTNGCLNNKIIFENHSCFITVCW